MNIDDITVVILAGGKGSRINNQDKGLLKLNNKPLIQYTLDTLKKANLNKILISANRNISKYQTFAQVIQDSLEGFQGPLAGISKAMNIVKTPYILILPCDCPMIDTDIINELTQHNADIVVASDDKRVHYTIAIIKTSLKEDLNQFLEQGNRKLGLWYQQHQIKKVKFSNKEKFINLNSEQDFSQFFEVVY